MLSSLSGYPSVSSITEPANATQVAALKHIKGAYPNMCSSFDGDIVLSEAFSALLAKPNTHGESTSDRPHARESVSLPDVCCQPTPMAATMHPADSIRHGDERPDVL